MKHRKLINARITLDGESAEVELDAVIQFDYRPGTPDVMYSLNGDPGYEGDPEELDIRSVRAAAGTSAEFPSGRPMIILEGADIEQYVDFPKLSDDLLEVAAKQLEAMRMEAA